jgi:paraquat-inducible protein B
LDKSLPGLHVILQTDKLGSLHRNAPVTYKQISVGHVSNYKYDPIKDIIDINVFIEPKYTDLVKKNTRFWGSRDFPL